MGNLSKEVVKPIFDDIPEKVRLEISLNFTTYLPDKHAFSTISKLVILRYKLLKDSALVLCRTWIG